MVLPLIIDCDPGVDDAIALLLAFLSPQLQVLGVTTVAGNVPLETTQGNARRVRDLAGRLDVPVFAGCPRPLVRSPVFAERVHGTDGLGGVPLPPPQGTLAPGHAVTFLLQTLLQAREPVTLAMLGPLTNLAVALIQEPRIAKRIREVVIMGGAIGAGNVTSSAEFNIYADPHAAHVVLTSGIPLTLVPLDMTHTAIATASRREAIANLETPIAQVVAQMLANYSLEEQEASGLPGPPLHDPCVIAYLLAPQLFRSQPFYVAVELASPLTLGRTIVDLHKEGDNAPNVDLLRSVDVDGFFALLTQRLSDIQTLLPSPRSD